MRRWGSTWTTVGLIVLASVAVVLAFAALQNTRGTAEPEPLASALTDPTQDSGQTTGDDDGGKGSLSDALPDTVEPPLLMVSPTLAYRAKAGSCLGGSELERSTNAGKKWTTLDAPAPAVLSLSSTGGDALTVVGADAACDVQVWTSTDQGETWSAPTPASDVFVRVPDDPKKLLTPAGVVKNPCPDRSEVPVSVDGVSAVDAAVLCASGDVVMTQDGGGTWTTQSPVVGGVAMTFESPALGWALRLNSGQCPSYQLMQTQDAGLTWQTGGCLGVDPVTDDHAAASLSFADPDNGMADIGGPVYLTSDSGLTWQGPR